MLYFTSTDEEFGCTHVETSSSSEDEESEYVYIDTLSSTEEEESPSVECTVCYPTSYPAGSSEIPLLGAESSCEPVPISSVCPAISIRGEPINVPPAPTNTASAGTRKRGILKNPLNPPRGRRSIKRRTQFDPVVQFFKFAETVIVAELRNSWIIVTRRRRHDGTDEIFSPDPRLTRGARRLIDIADQYPNPGRPFAPRRGTSDQMVPIISSMLARLQAAVLRLDVLVGLCVRGQHAEEER